VSAIWRQAHNVITLSLKKKSNAKKDEEKIHYGKNGLVQQSFTHAIKSSYQ